MAACRNLSQAEFEAPRTGFFPSLKKTLYHILVVDHFYVDALEGEVARTEGVGGSCVVRHRCSPSDRTIRGRQAAHWRLRETTPDSLYEVVRVNRNERVQAERRDRLLMHLFSIRFIIEDRPMPCSRKQPSSRRNLDEFFAADEAHLRAEEFSELGWTEQTVWKP